MRKKHDYSYMMAGTGRARWYRMPIRDRIMIRLRKIRENRLPEPEGWLL